MQVPRISVVMPVFNARSYLGKSIESILGQTESNFELLACDDGSADGSLELLRQYSSKDARVVVRSGPHRGYCHWLNQGIQEARAPYIARMDADDISLPRRFELQANHLDAHPDVVAVGGQIQLIDEEGDPLDEWRLPADHEQIDRNHLQGDKAGLAHPAVMLRRDALLQVGGYRCEFEPAEDLDLWYRLAEHGKLANLPDILLQLREHPCNVSRTRAQQQWENAQRANEQARERRRLAKHQLPRRPILEGEALLKSRLGRALGAGHRETGRKYALRLLRSRPQSFGNWLNFGRAFTMPRIRTLVHRTLNWLHKPVTTASPLPTDSARVTP